MKQVLNSLMTAIQVMAYIDTSGVFVKDTPAQVKESHYSLEKLDEAFLFSISLVSLAFTIIQVYQASLLGLIQIIPLLVLGVALPFYVGYLRGAIYDSLIERLRGWVYLIVGVNAYCAFLALTLPSWFALTSLFFIMVAVISIQHMETWFKNVFSFEETAPNMYSFSGTVASSFILAFSFVFVNKLLVNSQFSVFVLQIVMIYLSFMIAVASEKLSREVQRAQINTNIEDLKADLIKDAIVKRGNLVILTINLAMKLAKSGVLEIGKKSKYILFISLFLFLFGTFFLDPTTSVKIPEILPEVAIFIGMLLFALSVFPFLKLKNIDYFTLIMQVSFIMLVSSLLGMFPRVFSCQCRFLLRVVWFV
jgi:hypothetical protein